MDFAGISKKRNQPFFEEKIDLFFDSFLKTLLMFFLIYSFSPFSEFSFFNTARITIVILLVITFFKGGFLIQGKSTAVRCFFVFLFMQLFVVLYSFFLIFVFGLGTGETITSSAVNYLIFYGVCFFVLCSAFRSVEELMKVLIYATLLQCLVIVFCKMSSGFCVFIDNVFNSSSSWDYAAMRAKGYNAGISCITSTGSFQLCWGLIGCSFFLMKGKEQGYTKYVFCFVLISIISILVARTSFFLSILFFLGIGMYSIFSGDKSLKSRFLRTWSPLLLLLLFVFVISISLGYFTSIFNRFFALFNGGFIDFFKGYFASSTTVIPPLTWKTIVGTATISGQSGNGVYVNADGGFVRMYCALGLPLSILYYSILFFLSMKMIFTKQTRKGRYFSFLIFFSLVLLEFKEMHFGAGTFVTLVFLVNYLVEDDEKRYNVFGLSYRCLTI